MSWRERTKEWKLSHCNQYCVQFSRCPYARNGRPSTIPGTRAITRCCFFSSSLMCISRQKQVGIAETLLREVHVFDVDYPKLNQDAKTIFHQGRSRESTCDSVRAFANATGTQRSRSGGKISHQFPIPGKITSVRDALPYTAKGI